MTYLSVCSGIEAASVAWRPLGWRAAAFSEIEKFPSAVPAHHYPDVPNLGDMTKFHDWPDIGRINLLVGGTPCQSFSVAGLRKGLADPRGNLALTYLALVDKYRPAWVVWENVPGVLSSNKGRDFGSFLGGLAELGYGWAYRSLDAQYAGVPQRRERVFVVGHSGDWRRAAEVLFEPHSLSGDSPPRRETGQGVAGTIAASTGGSDENDARDGRLVAAPLTGVPYADNEAQESKLVVTHSLRAEGFDAGEDGTGRGTPIVAATLRSGSSNPASHGKPSGLEETLIPIAFDCKAGGNTGFSIGYTPGALRGGGHGGGHAAIAFDTTQITSPGNFSRPQPGDPCHPLARGAHAPAVAFQTRIARNGRGQPSEICPALSGADAGETSDMRPCVAGGIGVRRLTPTECARLQGFPDDYLDITFNGKPACDGPKYKALGNSMAVPVMAWIGRRIASVHLNPSPAS